MCECCCAKCKDIAEILPAWWLVQATKDGEVMKKDDYGLVLINGPSYIWAGIPPKETEDENNYFALMDFCDEIYDCFNSDPLTGHQLVSACLEAGYDPEKDGYHVLYWLMNRIAEKLEKKD